MATRQKVDHNLTFTDQDYELHVLLLSRSKVKSSLKTSTLMAGFALVSVTFVWDGEVTGINMCICKLYE